MWQMAPESALKHKMIMGDQLQIGSSLPAKANALMHELLINILSLFR
jgi:hypothetical protein